MLFSVSVRVPKEDVYLHPDLDAYLHLDLDAYLHPDLDAYLHLDVELWTYVFVSVDHTKIFGRLTRFSRTLYVCLDVNETLVVLIKSCVM